MADITLEPRQFTLKIVATRRELQELQVMVSQWIDENRHTSGDSPVWGFLTHLEDVLEGLDKQ